MLFAPIYHQLRAKAPELVCMSYEVSKSLIFVSRSILPTSQAGLVHALWIAGGLLSQDSAFRILTILTPILFLRGSKWKWLSCLLFLVSLISGSLETEIFV